MNDDKPEMKDDAVSEEAGAKDAPAPVPEAEELSSEVLKELREKAAKADEYLDLARRTKADFSNYQDRIRREKEEWRRHSVEGFVKELLPALDGLALAKFDDPKLVEAIRVLEKEFLRVLAKEGVVPIDTKGKEFNPQYHEALGVEEGGTVLEEVRRGWLINGFVVRPTSVRIVKPRADKGPEETPRASGSSK